MGFSGSFSMAHSEKFPAGQPLEGSRMLGPPTAVVLAAFAGGDDWHLGIDLEFETNPS